MKSCRLTAILFRLFGGAGRKDGAPVHQPSMCPNTVVATLLYIIAAQHAETHEVYVCVTYSDDRYTREFPHEATRSVCTTLARVRHHSKRHRTSISSTDNVDGLLVFSRVCLLLRYSLVLPRDHHLMGLSFAQNLTHIYQVARDGRTFLST